MGKVKVAGIAAPSRCGSTRSRIVGEDAQVESGDLDCPLDRSAPVQANCASRPSISAAACQSPRAWPWRSRRGGPRRRGPASPASGVRLAELLVGRDLVLGVVGDQGQQPLAALLDVPLAQALHGQAVAEERVGRVLGQALLQLHPSRRFLGHHSPLEPGTVRTATTSVPDDVPQA